MMTEKETLVPSVSIPIFIIRYAKAKNIDATLSVSVNFIQSLMVFIGNT